jgi:hypothetical protein
VLVPQELEQMVIVDAAPALFLYAAVACWQGAGDGAGALVVAQGCWGCSRWLQAGRNVGGEGCRINFILIVY